MPTANWVPEGTIRTALNTDSLQIARAWRDALARADEELWRSLQSELPSALDAYEAARERAMARGFIYIPAEELAAQATMDETLSRLKKIEPSSLIVSAQADAISRDAPYFGFPIPGQRDKYLYVWVDAPIGYIASLCAHSAERGTDGFEIWNDHSNEIIHIIGKDIAYFHTLFWPAMLMGAGWRTPSTVHCHGFLTVEGRKMSKSRGTFIAASAMAEAVNPEYFRYFLFTRLNDSVDDIDFSTKPFVDVVNADIINNVVNLGARASMLLCKNFNGKLSAYVELDDDLLEWKDKLDAVLTAITNFKIKDGANIIRSMAAFANKNFAEAAPWALIKGSEAERRKAHIVCTQALLTYRAALIAWSPIMPDLTKKGLQQFDDFRSSEDDQGIASFGSKAAILEIQVREFSPIAERLVESDLIKSLGLEA